jgi:DedD protein
MNEEDGPEKPSGFLFGKEFIIVLVIIFSGASFTLGYFVGRNTIDPAPIAPLQTAEGTAQQRGQDALPALPAQAPLPPAENMPAGSAAQPSSVQPASASSGTEVAPGSGAAAVPKEQQKNMDPFAPAGAEKTAARTDTGDRTDEKKRLYSVQIGAFKSTDEAKQLKARFEKKGYKPFISVAKDRKGHKIYKVKTGEFPDKKDAEVLALKLKKAEGLHAYVTTKSE